MKFMGQQWVRPQLFVGHDNVLKELGDHSSPVIPLPDVTFKDHYTLKPVGRTLVPESLGPNH